MPTIVFASPKGGAGKSTSAVVLATELALSGANVTVIDADPNRPGARWGRLCGFRGDCAHRSGMMPPGGREQEAAFRVKIPAAILLIHRLSRFS